MSIEMNLLANDRAASGEFGSGLAEFEPPVDFENEAKSIIVSSTSHKSSLSKKNFSKLEDLTNSNTEHFRHHHSKTKYYNSENQATEKSSSKKIENDSRPISRSIRHLGSPRRGDFPQSHQNYPVFEEIEVDTSTLEVEFEAEPEVEDDSGECDFTIIFDDGGQQSWLRNGIFLRLKN